jgi:hypothetical protein
MKTKEFYFIDDAKKEQRKLQKKGFKTKIEIVGTPEHGYGAIIHYKKKLIN